MPANSNVETDCSGRRDRRLLLQIRPYVTQAAGRKCQLSQVSAILLHGAKDAAKQISKTR